MEHKSLGVTVAQLGARRHYAVPLAFYEAGILQRFFTDVYLKGWTADVIGAAASVCTSPALQRLQGRQAVGLPRNLVQSFPWFGALASLKTKRIRDASEVTENWLLEGQRFCELILNKGLGEGAVYGFSSACLELLQAVARQGRPGVVDSATAPMMYEERWLTEEKQAFPGWGLSEESNVFAEIYDDRQRKEWTSASLVVCASTYMRKILLQEGVPEGKVVVVPLGLVSDDATPAAQSRGGRPLRVLCVGNGGLLKGLGYLVKALDLLPVDSFECRLVGNLQISATGIEALSKTVECIGSVPRSLMAEQYRWADVFVLPSLSETFGLVLLEAMRWGLPILTTEHTAGADIVSEGREGFVVPVRQPEALAKKMEWWMRHEKERFAMGRAAAETAKKFTLKTYSATLAQTVKKHICDYDG